MDTMPYDKEDNDDHVLSCTFNTDFVEILKRKIKYLWSLRKIKRKFAVVCEGVETKKLRPVNVKRLS